MSINLHALNAELVDGENNPIRLDVVYSIKKNQLVESLDAIRKEYGANICILPISGASGGGGVFQTEKPADGTIIGLRIEATPCPQVRFSDRVNIESMSLDEIVIDQRNSQIYAGAAITLEQLNQVLRETVGNEYRVLGADLTSYTYAQVGATFMTGGMGPQRRYFSDSVNEIALYDGASIISITGKKVRDYAACYGWCGIVTAVRCDYVSLPPNEIAFAIPINNGPESLARLLQHFSPYTYLTEEKRIITTLSGENHLILGLEHITTHSMDPLLTQGFENSVSKRIRNLSEKCRAACADGLVFVSGYSPLVVDEFLFKLVDDVDARAFTIAGIELEHTEVFNNPDEMRALREAIPFAARTQDARGKFVYKGHTDANIRLNKDCVETAMNQLWGANERYVSLIDSYFSSISGLKGEILVYGHLNPVGVDPHNRITFSCDDEFIYQQACSYVHDQRNQFLQDLQRICEETDSVFVGGEKGAGSESEMLEAFGDIGNAPSSLITKFNRQRNVIRSAAPMFNWRAPTIYSA